MIRSKQIQRPQLVLVVDDQEINRDILEAILSDDYEVICAENGKQALKIMRRRQDELSIVLLDLMMPVMDGFAVLEKVRDDEQLGHIPVIVLTADRNAELRALKLEVTESACTDNAKDLLDVIRRLRSIGFEVEMDDFGSGYPSLNPLADMPIDVLKMDMAFVRNIESSDTDYMLVKLILDIARHLKLKVVAEGVEHEGQLALLKDAGCDLVQGFYFSRPVPAEAFRALIEKEKEIERG